MTTMTTTCTAGCDRPVKARGMCDSCYHLRRGDGRLRSGLVPADPARRHAAHLEHAGWSVAALARATGLSVGSVHRLLRGQPARVQADTANRVLAVQPADPPTQATMWTLVLPWTRPPLRSNDRFGDPRARARVVRQVRDTVTVLGKHHKLPTGKHLTVQLHYAPGTWQRMDSHNLHDTVKACVDALAKPTRRVDPHNPRSRPWVGLQLVPDDDDRYVTVLTPQIHRPPTAGPRTWLTVEVAR